MNHRAARLLRALPSSLFCALAASLAGPAGAQPGPPPGPAAAPTDTIFLVLQPGPPARLDSALAAARAEEQEARRAGDRARLEFEQGQLQTESFKLEGPDVRAFASGGVDIGREPHPVDAEVVLFLFRPIDSVLEKIPLLNLLLLGTNRNLVAAHFDLEGPWSDPKARLLPLRSLATGPGSLVFETLPKLLLRGLQEFDALLSSEPEAKRATPLEAPPAES